MWHNHLWSLQSMALYTSADTHPKTHSDTKIQQPSRIPSWWAPTPKNPKLQQ